MEKIPVILHLDLDCFYAQVESIRLNIDQKEPLALQQWGSLLAVNYASRPYKVQRGDSIKVARQKCPEIHLPHVAVLGVNESQVPDITKQKACLRRYRTASKEIFNVITKHVPVYEKASIDEVYLDVTDKIHERFEQLLNASALPYSCVPKSTKLVGGGELVGSKMEQCLLLGAEFANMIRNDVYQKLKYTCSVGVAHNKLLAKLVSPLNKPNGQAVLMQQNVSEYMRTLKVTSINGFGGKLGDTLVKLGVGKVDELQEFTLGKLKEELGDEKLAAYVFWRIRGVDQDRVTAKSRPKSITSSKNFIKGLVWSEGIEKWVGIFMSELVDRLQEEEEEYARYATRLTISYSPTLERNSTGNMAAHKSIALVLERNPTVDILVRKIMKVLEEHKGTIFPCYNISFSAKSFIEKPTTQGIASYFQVQSPSKDKHITNVSRASVLSKAVETTFQCTKCLRTIPIQKRQEHLDFHFALSMTKEWSSQVHLDKSPLCENVKKHIKPPTSVPPHVGCTKKRKEASGNHTLHAFFSSKKK